MDKNDIARLRQTVSAFERPVLSLYANTNWGDPATSPDAVVARIKNTLKTLNVPESLIQRVVHHFEYSPPRGRAAAAFADAAQLEVFPFQLEFIHDAAHDYVEARYGEPYFTPLVAAEHAPYFVVHAERDQVRIFELFMGRVEQLRHEQRQRSPAEDDSLQTSEKRFPKGLQRSSPAARSPNTQGNTQNQPKYIADRGDAAAQLAHERLAHLQKLFYQGIAESLQELTRERGVERLVLMGPQRDAHLLLSTLPQQLANGVVAVETNTNGEEPSVSLIERRVVPTVEAAERRRKKELLRDIAERGVTGLEPCLKELQQGRLHTLAVALEPNTHIYVNRPSGYAAPTKGEAAKADEQGSIEPVDLLQEIPELAEHWGARLVFVEEADLAQRLGGMGGLRRW